MFFPVRHKKNEHFLEWHKVTSFDWPFMQYRQYSRIAVPGVLLITLLPNIAEDFNRFSGNGF